MAATRLISMHLNKGKSIQQCLKDRTDYAQNPEKTDDGILVSSYECDPKLVEEQFALAKSEYLHNTGRHYHGDVIAYQIRQAFKPGEITPEEANRIGYETAMHWIRKTPILKSSSMLLIGKTRRCLAVLIAVKRRLFLIY